MTGKPYTPQEIAKTLYGNDNMGGRNSGNEGSSLAKQGQNLLKGLGGAVAGLFGKPAAAAGPGSGFAEKIAAMEANNNNYYNKREKAAANAEKAAKAAANLEENVRRRAFANPYGEAGVRYSNAVEAAGPEYQGRGKEGLAALMQGINPAAGAPGGGMPVFGMAPNPGSGAGHNQDLRNAFVFGTERSGGRRRSRKSRKSRKSRSRKNRRSRK